jgi:hypothetical protein
MPLTPSFLIVIFRVQTAYRIHNFNLSNFSISPISSTWGAFLSFTISHRVCNTFVKYLTTLSTGVTSSRHVDGATNTVKIIQFFTRSLHGRAAQCNNSAHMFCVKVRKAQFIKLVSFTKYDVKQQRKQHDTFNKCNNIWYIPKLAKAFELIFCTNLCVRNLFIRLIRTWK